MKRSTFLAIAGVFAALFGLPFLLFPDQAATNFGMQVSPSVISFAHATGVLLVGFGIVNWAVRNEALTKALKGIMWANIFVHLVSLFFAYFEITDHVVNSNGWVGVIVHAVFAAGFAYYLFVSKEN